MRKLDFITGPAGTGKTHRLKELLKKETRPHLICAPTGIAAINAGGSTIHRTFKINNDSGFIGKRWTEIQVVYIDEASMMGQRLFEYVVKGAPHADIVLVGDMAQLPPVKDRFWFQSEYINMFDLSIERLTKNYRQANDHQLNKTLNNIRSGTVSRDELNSLYRVSLHPDDNEDCITLAYRNDTVRAINSEKLLAITSELFEFKAEYSGAMKESDCNAEGLLMIKTGAQIVMLNNDIDGRWSNGTRGVVKSIGYDPSDEIEYINVIIEGKLVSVPQHTWQLKVPTEITPARMAEIQGILNDPYNVTANKNELRHVLLTGIEYVVIGICKQFPMKLAFALTVHKSQGMTLDNVHIITSGFAGTHGIGYVALSRARSIDTVSFNKKLVPADFKFNQILKEYI